MKYTVEIGSGAKFNKDWFRYSEVDRGYTGTQTAWRYHKPNLIIQAQVPS
jgi:hypothetical protein